MEPPFKKRRVPDTRYPEIDLHARRAQNDYRLKSIFESIFDKYGKHFDGIGDEIDMETGEIVVNNGHLQGMTDERDVGNAKDSCEELGSSSDKDDSFSIRYSEEHLAALGPSEAALEEESEASGQSDFDADSLMGDVPLESHLHQLGRKSLGAISISSGDEVDELASSDTERMSDSFVARENRRLFKDKHSFADEPAIEAAWRAPPLPNRSFNKRGREKVRPTKPTNMREFSDDERAGISLWTPEVKKLSRRRRESIQRSRDLERSQDTDGCVQPSDLSDSGVAGRKPIREPVSKPVRWTQEEEERLIHLKTSTNLTSTAMIPYFSKRQTNSIASHWNQMVAQGRVSLNPAPPETLDRKTPLPKESPGKTSPVPEGTCPELYHPNTFSKSETNQIIEQRPDRGCQEMGDVVWSSSKPIEQLGDHITSDYQIDDDQGTLKRYANDQPVLDSNDVGAHIGYTMSNSFSSEKNSKTDEGFNRDESLYDSNKPSGRTADQHLHASGREYSRLVKSSQYRDQERNRRVRRVDPLVSSSRRSFDDAPYMDGGCQPAGPLYQAIPNDSYGDIGQSCSLPKTLEIKAGDGSELHRDGSASSKTQPRAATTTDEAPPQRPETRESAPQQRESIPTTVEDNIQKQTSLRETNGPTELSSIDSAQLSEHGVQSALHMPDVEVTKRQVPARHIVQVVIPFAASKKKSMGGGTKQKPLSLASTGSRLADTDTADHNSMEQYSTAMESKPTALGPISPIKETLVIRTPTRSPSVAAAESQYAVSAAFGINNARPSLGPEIADSQPLSTTLAVATPLREIGNEVSKPIILDIEPSSLLETPRAVISARKQPTKSSKSIALAPDSQLLRETPGTASAGQNLIEESLESDIAESGSHPLGKTVATARSPSKKVEKEISGCFSSTWTAFDDCSEDELSYL